MALKFNDKESSQSDKGDLKAMKHQETVSSLINLFSKDVVALTTENEELVRDHFEAFKRRFAKAEELAGQIGTGTHIPRDLVPY